MRMSGEEETSGGEGRGEVVLLVGGDVGDGCLV